MVICPPVHEKSGLYVIIVQDIEDFSSVLARTVVEGQIDFSYIRLVGQVLDICLYIVGLKVLF